VPVVTAGDEEERARSSPRAADSFELSSRQRRSEPSVCYAHSIHSSCNMAGSEGDSTPGRHGLVRCSPRSLPFLNALSLPHRAARPVSKPRKEELDDVMSMVERDR